jgi:ligand-binding sensor domain-containing protein
MINVIMEDSFGGMWFGSYVAPRGGIGILKDNKWQAFTTKDALLHANINAMIQLADKSVVVGGGLYTKGGGTRFIYETNGWIKKSNLTKKDGLAGEKIRSLFEDSQKRLWIGSEYDGLAVINGNKITKLTKKNGLSNDEVKVMKEDRENNIWIGTREGLVRITKGNIDEGVK